MKKILVSILSTLILNTNLFSADNSNTYYNDYINNFITKEKSIIDYVYQYIYATADYSITRNELSTFYSINKENFKNLNNETCISAANGFCNDAIGGIGISVDTTMFMLTLSDHYSKDLVNKIPQQTIINYQNSPFLPSNFILSGKDLKVVLEPTMVKFITTVKDIEKYRIYLSSVAPTDPAVYTWIKPNNNAVLSVYLKDLDNKWNHATDIDKYTLDYNIKLNKSLNFDINLIVLPDNAIITFYSELKNELEGYISKDKKWYPLKNKAKYDVWTGDSALYALACTIFDKPSTSKGKVGTQDPYIDVAQTFVKYDDFDGGYWNSDKYYVVGKYDTLPPLNFKANKYDIGYICSVDGTKYDTLYNIKDTGTSWYYLSKNIDGLSYYDTKEDNDKLVMSWNVLDSRSDTLKYLFKGTKTAAGDTIWKSTYLYNSGTPIVNTTIHYTSSSKSRNAFTDLNYNIYYLTPNHDCATTAKCNGTDPMSHSGWKMDDLYVWVYDGTGLIDAFPINDPNEMYNTTNAGKFAYLLTTTNKIYIQEKDTNGNNVYREKGTNNFLTAKNQVVPSTYLYNGFPSFPKKVLSDLSTGNDVDISGANVDYINSKIVLKDKQQLVYWNTNLNNNTLTNISGISGDYIVVLNGGKPYWKNDTTKEYLTNATRDNLPTAANDTYTYLSLQIGCLKNTVTDIEMQCRYTNTGLKHYTDVEFYQWHYAPTTKSINNLIDIEIFNTLAEMYDAGPVVGYVVATNKNYMKMNDSNGNKCYYELANVNNVVDRNGNLFPFTFITVSGSTLNEIHVPINKTCSNISFNGISVVFADRTEMLGWTNAKYNLSAYLSINTKEYTVDKTYNDTLYFNSISANEKVSFSSPDVFGAIPFSGLYTKYITKTLGSGTLYNSGLLINDHVSNGKNITVAGAFSNNDKLLYVFYDNTTNTLLDVFHSSNISDIYDDKKNFVFFNNINTSTQKLLQLEPNSVNGSDCYVDKGGGVSNYNYVLKSDGSNSITKNNFPSTINCTTAQFYNGALIVSDMITAINWTNAENNFAVTTGNKSTANTFYLEKGFSTFYWINNKNLNITTSDGTNPNTIYALNRSKIDTVPNSNTFLKVLTTSIANEPTNLALGVRSFYEFYSYKKLDDTVEDFSNKVNGAGDFFTPTNVDMMVFENITSISTVNNFVSKILTTGAKYNPTNLFVRSTGASVGSNSIANGGLNDSLTASNTYNSILIQNNSQISSQLQPIYSPDIGWDLLSIYDRIDMKTCTLVGYAIKDNTILSQIISYVFASTAYQLNRNGSSTYPNVDIVLITKTSSTNPNYLVGLPKVYLPYNGNTAYYCSDGVFSSHSSCKKDTTNKYIVCPYTITEVPLCNSNSQVLTCPVGTTDNGTNCIEKSYIINTSSGNYAQTTLLAAIYSLKYNSSTSEYYIVSYNETTNAETPYDLSQITHGTLITNSVTGKKFLVLYDNIKNKNSIKPIN